MIGGYLSKVSFIILVFPRNIKKIHFLFIHIFYIWWLFLCIMRDGNGWYKLKSSIQNGTFNTEYVTSFQVCLTLLYFITFTYSLQTLKFSILKIPTSEEVVKISSKEFQSIQIKIVLKVWWQSHKWFEHFCRRTTNKYKKKTCKIK